MAKLRFIPSNVVSQRVTGVTCWTMGCEVPTGGTANTASIAQAGTNTTNQYQVTPGATNTTGAASLPTDPNGKGWIIDYKGFGDITAATHTFKLRCVPTAGTWTITVKIWLVNINASNLPTNVNLISDLTFSSVTSATTQPLSTTFSVGAGTIDDSGFLYFEVWARQTAGGAADNQVAMQVNNTNNEYWWEIDGLTDCGVIDTADKTNKECVVWTNQIAMGRDRWGELTFIKNMATGEAYLTRDEWSASAANDRAPIQWQHLHSGAGQNQSFQITPGDIAITKDFNNPILKSVRVEELSYGGSYGSSDYFNIISAWYGMPTATYTNWWEAASANASVAMNLRYANTSANFTNPFTGFAQSTSAAGADGWFYRTATNKALYGIPDRHRGLDQRFTFINDGSNVNSSAINALQDGTNVSLAEFGGRVLVAVEAVTGDATGKDKWLNNFNDNLNGPPDSANSRLAVSSGKGTIASDSDTSYSGIKNGFDYQHMAYRLAANGSNEVLCKLEALASYALPFRAFIITGYTDANAPVVGTSATEGGAPTELDSGKTVGNSTTYKGTNYASHVDTTNDIAFVVIYGEQAAGNTTWYTIKPALSQAYSQQVNESITLSDTVVKTPKKVVADTITATDAMVKAVAKAIAESVTLTDAVVKKAIITLAETITGSDSVVKKAIKPLAETVTLTDAWVKAITKPLAESITLSDGWAILPKKVISESITLADEMVKRTVKALTETITGSDTVVKKPIKVLTDTIEASDEAVKKAVKALAETITLADALVKKPIKALADTISLSDDQRYAVQKVILETLIATDTVTKGAVKRLSDSVTVSDVLDVFVVIVLMISESITVADAMTRKAMKVVAETINVSEATARFPKKVIQETINASDAVVKAIGKVIQETVNATDAVIKGATRKINETIFASDALARQLSLVIAEMITVADAWLMSFVVARALTFVANMREAVGAQRTFRAQILGYLASTLRLRTNFLKLVSNRLTTKSNMRMLTADTLTERANITNAVGKDLTVVNAVRANVAAPLTLRQTISALLPSMLTVQANVLTTAAKSLTVVGAVRGLVAQTLTVRRNIVAFVAQYLYIKANINQLAGKSITTKADMYQLVTKGLTTKVNFLTLVGDTLSFGTAAISNAVGAALTVKQNMAELVNGALTSVASVRETVAKSLTTKSSFRELVAQDLTVGSSILGKTASSLVVVGGVLNAVGKAIRFDAKMGGATAKTLTLKQSILGTVASTFVFAGQVLTKAGASLTIVNSSSALVGRSFTSRVRIASLVGKNLVVLGRTRTLVGKDLTMRSGGLMPVGKALTFRMGGEGQVGNNLPIFVQINALVGKPLTITQNILPYVPQRYVVTPEATEFEVEAVPGYIISPVDPYEIEPMGV